MFSHPRPFSTVHYIATSIATGLVSQIVFRMTFVDVGPKKKPQNTVILRTFCGADETSRHSFRLGGTSDGTTSWVVIN